MSLSKIISVLIVVTMLTGCGLEVQKMTSAKNTFGDDVAFLKKHTDVIVLSDSSGNGRIAVVPAYQGRVMTSTAAGAEGTSFGWINHELIASGEIQPHINVYGGEDRFWMGPEGGQFAIFFDKGDEFNLDDWQTPTVIDTEPFDLISKTGSVAIFKKDTQLANYSGSVFNVHINRRIRVLDRDHAAEKLGVRPGETIKMVAYESINKIINTGQKAWEKETGLLSIWILGMFNPSADTTVAIPFRPGPENQLGPKVNDAYFGKIPPQRLAVTDDVLYFSGDGQLRSKIGVAPSRAMPILGSYNASEKTLTLVQYTLPAGAKDYVNSMWENQQYPYKGDAVNSYNDGPPEPGKKALGPFYELETSSPAAALQPGKSITHVHRTFHLQGSEADLDKIARATLKVGIEQIKSALPK